MCFEITWPAECGHEQHTGKYQLCQITLQKSMLPVQHPTFEQTCGKPLKWLERPPDDRPKGKVICKQCGKETGADLNAPTRGPAGGIIPSRNPLAEPHNPLTQQPRSK
ncbi:hypothetical protein M8818_004311 [Zalaria obscura]|uniref:Uncharacterized protein n=1 Tax=Zalaria obscura TaxID=2024903 RepID=A0ACC3SE37_9PEZI